MSAAHVLTHQVAEEPPAVPPARLTGHDSKKAMPVTLVLHLSSTSLLATEAVVHGNESHVKHARLPS